MKVTEKEQYKETVRRKRKARGKRRGGASLQTRKRTDKKAKKDEEDKEGERGQKTQGEDHREEDFGGG